MLWRQCQNDTVLAVVWVRGCHLVWQSVVIHTADCAACIASVVMFIVLRSRTAGEFEDVPSNYVVDTYVAAAVSGLQAFIHWKDYNSVVLQYF